VSTSAPENTDADAYTGVFGAYRFAVRRSESSLFRLYAVLFGGLLAAALAIGFGLALIVQIYQTLGGPGGSFTFARALFILVGLFVVAPLMAPVLFVARHHRRHTSDVRYDRLLAAAGLVFLATLYVGLIASIPAEFLLDAELATRPAPTGLTAPVVAWLYAIPTRYALSFPAAGALGILLAHRFGR